MRFWIRFSVSSDEMVVKCIKVFYLYDNIVRWELYWYVSSIYKQIGVEYSNIGRSNLFGNCKRGYQTVITIAPTRHENVFIITQFEFIPWNFNSDPCHFYQNSWSIEIPDCNLSILADLEIILRINKLQWNIMTKLLLIASFRKHCTDKIMSMMVL